MYKRQLHDGAMIIRHKRIEAAGCILPVSHDLNIPKELGLRHRAAMVDFIIKDHSFGFNTFIATEYIIQQIDLFLTTTYIQINRMPGIKLCPILIEPFR